MKYLIKSLAVVVTSAFLSNIHGACAQNKVEKPQEKQSANVSQKSIDKPNEKNVNQKSQAKITSKEDWGFTIAACTAYGFLGVGTIVLGALPKRMENVDDLLKINKEKHTIEMAKMLTKSSYEKYLYIINSMKNEKSNKIFKNFKNLFELSLVSDLNEFKDKIKKFIYQDDKSNNELNYQLLKDFLYNWYQFFQTCSKLTPVSFEQFAVSTKQYWLKHTDGKFIIDSIHDSIKQFDFKLWYYWENVTKSKFILNENAITPLGESLGNFILINNSDFIKFVSDKAKREGGLTVEDLCKMFKGFVHYANWKRNLIQEFEDSKAEQEKKP